MKKLCGKISNFAKTRPSLFVVCIIALVCILFFGTLEALHATSTSKFCGMCHKDEPSGPGGEYYTWEKNVHAYVNVGCIDCHGAPGLIGYMKAKMGGLKDLYGEIVYSQEHKMEILTKGAIDIDYAAKLIPNNTCLFCHSDEVNKQVREDTVMSIMGIKMRMIDKVVNPAFRELNGLPDLYTGKIVGVDPNHALHVKELNLSCANCHMGVAHGNEFNNLSKMQTCFDCHDLERPKLEKPRMPINEDCVKCHQLPLEEQEGKFLESKGIPETPWLMPSITGACESCHVDATTLPTSASCLPCHNDDKAYAEMYDSFRSDFRAQKEKITPLWMDLYKNVEKMTDAERMKFNEMNYFMNLINLDKSEGIHNTDLMNQVFEKATAIGEELKTQMKL